MRVSPPRWAARRFVDAAGRTRASAMQARVLEPHVPRGQRSSATYEKLIGLQGYGKRP
jgi:hypothetical protein